MYIGYKLSEANDDVCMKRDFKPNGVPYYKLMICSVDDWLYIDFKPKEDMDALNIIYWLNEVFVLPDQYLGANVEKVQLEYGRLVWSTNCVNYLKRAIENVDSLLGVEKKTLNNYGDGHRPYSSRFRPELYITEAMEDELTNSYQQLIGVLIWSIEFKRIDILTEEICLYQHLCYPREGQLDAVYRIFRYLQNNLGNKPGRMAYEPMYKPTYENAFEVFGTDLYEWKNFYSDAQEMMPRNMIEALGKYVVIKSYVNAN